MQQQELVQNLRTLELLYSDVYFLSRFKTDLLLNKNYFVSIRMQTDTTVSNLPVTSFEKSLLIKFLQELIFRKINEIVTIEKTMF